MTLSDATNSQMPLVLTPEFPPEALSPAASALAGSVKTHTPHPTGSSLSSLRSPNPQEHTDATGAWTIAVEQTKERKEPDLPGVPKTTGPILFPSQIRIFEFIVLGVGKGPREREGWRMGGLEGGTEGVHLTEPTTGGRAGLVGPRASYWLACHSDTDPPRVPFTETTEY